MNMHPALLPVFGGKGLYGDRVHRAILTAGVKVSGCTVHFADEQYDHGRIGNIHATVGCAPPDEMGPTRAGCPVYVDHPDVSQRTV